MTKSAREGDVGLINTKAKLTAKQKVIFNSMIEMAGLCAFCESKLAEKQKRGLMAQPISDYTDYMHNGRPGELQFIGICADCHIIISRAIMTCKNRKSK